MLQVDFPANVSDCMNFKAGRLWAGRRPPPRFSIGCQLEVYPELAEGLPAVRYKLRHGASHPVDRNRARVLPSVLSLWS